MWCFGQMCRNGSTCAEIWLFSQICAQDQHSHTRCPISAHDTLTFAHERATGQHVRITIQHVEISHQHVEISYQHVQISFQHVRPHSNMFRSHFNMFVPIPTCTFPYLSADEHVQIHVIELRKAGFPISLKVVDLQRGEGAAPA